MNYLRFRTKANFILSGANLMMAIIGAMSGAFQIMLISFVIGVWCWYAADFNLDEDLQNLAKQIKEYKEGE